MFTLNQIRYDVIHANRSIEEFTTTVLYLFRKRYKYTVFYTVYTSRVFHFVNSSRAYTKITTLSCINNETKWSFAAKKNIVLRYVLS